MASSTKEDDNGSNLAEELFAKTDKGSGKPGKPRDNPRNSHQEKPAARTAAATQSNTTAVEQQPAAICHQDPATMDNGT